MEGLFGRPERPREYSPGQSEASPRAGFPHPFGVAEGREMPECSMVGGELV
jgi:hypothetical protein